jgi:hypothetical protein
MAIVFAALVIQTLGLRMSRWACYKLSHKSNILLISKKNQDKTKVK